MPKPIRDDNRSNPALPGTAGDDRILALGGDDVIVAGAGDDDVVGGRGFDTAVFQGSFFEYGIDPQGTGNYKVVVSDRLADRDGADTLKQVEALQFSDATIYVDGRNNAPITRADSVTTDENTGITLDVLANDADFEGDPLSITHIAGSAVQPGQSVTLASGATVTLTLAGAIHYEPNGAGLEEFSYTVSDGQGGSSVEAVAIDVLPVTEGVAVDGYIAGATVFADADRDGILDAEEVSATTDESGSFSLIGGSGPLVLVGGTDTATGLPFEGRLAAPEGYEMVTPLTTLVSALVDRGAEPAAAEQQVLDALGVTLAPDQSLATLDPIAGATGGDPGAQQAFLAGSTVLDTVTMLGSILSGASGNAFDATSEDVFAALADAIAAFDPGQALNLNKTSVVGELLVDAAASQGLPPDSPLLDANSDLVAGASSVVAASNQAVTAAAADPGPIGLLAEVTAISIVAQGDASDALLAAAGGDTTIKQVQKEFSGDNLILAIEEARSDVGDVDGPDVNSAPVAFLDRPEAFEDTPLVIDAAELLANDIDLDGDPLTITAVGDAQNGTVVLDEAAQTITFTPDPDFKNGAASFIYTVADPSGATSFSLVKMFVAPVVDGGLLDFDEGEIVREVPGYHPNEGFYKEDEYLARNADREDVDGDGDSELLPGRTVVQIFSEDGSTFTITDFQIGLESNDAFSIATFGAIYEDGSHVTAATFDGGESWSNFETGEDIQISDFLSDLVQLNYAGSNVWIDDVLLA